LVGRVALAFVLTFAVGFERQIRGGPAGDRTYSLVGMAAAAIAAIAVAKGGANAIAGVVTGVGFIGAALVFRSEGGMLRGITSASAVLATAAVGVVAGAGYPILALAVTGGVLLSLEVRYLPVLRYLDARRYVGSVRDDTEAPGHSVAAGPTVLPTRSGETSASRRLPVAARRPRPTSQPSPRLTLFDGVAARTS